MKLERNLDNLIKIITDTSKTIKNLKQITNFISEVVIYQMGLKQCPQKYICETFQYLKIRCKPKRDLQLNTTLKVCHQNLYDHNFELENAVLLKNEDYLLIDALKMQCSKNLLQLIYDQDFFQSITCLLFNVRDINIKIKTNLKLVKSN